MASTLQTPLNAAQVEILKMFSQGLTDEQLEELRTILVAFRFKLLDEHVDQMVEEKGYTQEEINQASWGHRRAPYRSKQQTARQKGKS